MPFVLEIDGVDKSDEISRAEIRLGLNERASATFECDPEITLPDRFDEIVAMASDGVTPFFGGVIFTRNIQGLTPGSEADNPVLDCQDFGIYAAWTFVSLTYASSIALENVLDDLVDLLPPSVGITYTPAATGITLQP